MATQTIKAIIEVRGADLKEGQYLEAALTARSEENAYEVSRNLLVDRTKLFVIKDSVLDLVTVSPIFENQQTVVVKGLQNDTQILAKPIPGAHSGMLVKVFNDNKKQ